MNNLQHDLQLNIASNYFRAKATPQRPPIFSAFYNNQTQPETDKKQLNTIKKIEKDNGIITVFKNLGKKTTGNVTFNAIVLSILTVVGLAYVGNKFSTPTARLGEKVDDILLNNNNLIGKVYLGIANAFKSAGNTIAKPFKKMNWIQDLKETFANRKAHPKINMARGYERGPVGIFSMTPVDILQTVFNKSTRNIKQLLLINRLNIDEKTAKKLAKLAPQELTNKLYQMYPTDNPKAIATFVSSLDSVITKQTAIDLSKLIDEDKIPKFLSKILEKEPIVDNRLFCQEFSNAVIEHFKKNPLCKDMSNTEIFNAIQSGKVGDLDLSLFKDITMNKSSGVSNIITQWWPVNIINKVKKFFAPNSKDFGTGNLGDSLIKFNAINGTLAKTAPGRFLQKLITLPTECISNFVNDKSGFGTFISLNLISLFKNVQMAPKDKKAATVADDFGSQMGSWIIATPLAFKTTYGLATLANLKGTSFLTKYLLRPIGKLFSIGLQKDIGHMSRKDFWNTKILNTAGGLMRFALIMFVFGNMFRKPITWAVHKVFGKPFAGQPHEQYQQTAQTA